MILNDKPEQTAVLTNVAEVSAFTIKATAKSFQILSSGLYANKIRAIIRELSCNAYDSHVGAGKSDVPFEVHIPNTYEPWFSVKDFGLGLDHSEVINIFTTYFESTKTGSNDYVGALGLGSKSPFSYTENFTITANKNGVCSIYSAFINDLGVPSVALLNTSSDPDLVNGVEIKFSVENSYDISKFQNEAVSVYYWFTTRPIIKGWSAFQSRLDDMTKELTFSLIDESLIPDVKVAVLNSNYYSGPWSNKSNYAIMGNIAYPIEVPNAEANLGKNLLQFLNLKNNNSFLMIKFVIGDIEFQASREGLSYTKKTIDAIRAKLQFLSDNLEQSFEKIVAEQDVNAWEFPMWLHSYQKMPIWKSIVQTWTEKNPSKWYYQSSYNGFAFASFKYSAELMDSCNVQVYSPGKRDSISPLRENVIVINDTKNRGKAKLVRYIKTLSSKKAEYYLIEKKDRVKDMDLDTFMEAIGNPSESIIVKLSSLVVPNEPTERTKRTAVPLLRVVDRGRRGGYGWSDINSGLTLDQIDDPTSTFYYLPVVGFQLVDTKVSDINTLMSYLTKCGLFGNIVVYGVRKSEHQKVQTKTNWVNLEDHIVNTLMTQKDAIKIEFAADGSEINTSNLKTITLDKIEKKVSDKSPFYKIVKIMSVVQKKNAVSSWHSTTQLANVYGLNFLDEFNKFKNSFRKEVDNLTVIYPMLRYAAQAYTGYGPTFTDHIIDYVNLVDKNNSI
jgi:hypothetical protein